MIYILFAVIAVLSTAVIAITAARKGVVDFGGKIKLYKPCDEAVVPFKNVPLILIITVCFALALAVQILLYKNTEAVAFIKLYGLFVIVMCAAVIDSKRRIIPNILIIAGFIFRAGIYVYEFITADDIKAVIVNDLIGFAIGFVFLGLVSIISKGALGFGDAKLFGVIGVLSGSFCTYSTLLISLIVSLIVSLINILIRKKDRKTAFPFGPCIAAGYIISVLLTSY